jgi:hypothetical protein
MLGRRGWMDGMDGWMDARREGCSSGTGSSAPATMGRPVGRVQWAGGGPASQRRAASKHLLVMGCHGARRGASPALPWDRDAHETWRLPRDDGDDDDGRRATLRRRDNEGRRHPYR